MGAATGVTEVFDGIEVVVRICEVYEPGFGDSLLEVSLGAVINVVGRDVKPVLEGNAVVGELEDVVEDVVEAVVEEVAEEVVEEVVEVVAEEVVEVVIEEAVEGIAEEVVEEAVEEIVEEALEEVLGEVIQEVLREVLEEVVEEVVETPVDEADGINVRVCAAVVATMVLCVGTAKPATLWHTVYAPEIAAGGI